MLRLLDRVNTIAHSDAPVLLSGESGTGKELVARTLHERGAAPGKAVRRRELRRLPRDADRGRAVRPRARRLHGRGQEARRPLPAPPTAARCSSTRSPRCRCRRRRSCCACCRRGRDRAARHQRVGAGRRARRLGDPPRPQGADRRGPVPRGPLLPAQRPRHRHPAAARAQGRPAAAGAVLPAELGKPGSAAAPLSPAAWAALSQFAFPGNVRELAHAIEHAVVLAGAARSTSSTCRATSRTRATWSLTGSTAAPARWAPR